MNRILILSLFILSTINLSLAQGMHGGQVSGVVTDESGEPVPYASISVKGSSRGTVSDYTGRFQLGNLDPGSYVLVVSSLGYKQSELALIVGETQPQSLVFRLVADVLNLEQLVVTGTRSSHFVKDVPIRTEVITFKEIESKNAANIFQALEGLPGVRVESQCQSCNFTMVRMQGLDSEHTQILIDGQPMYSGLAGVYGLQQMSTVDVSRIEIVKGAGSALYGSGAVAGAINVVTREPSLIPETRLNMQMGSYGTNRYEIFSSMRNEKGNVGLNIFAHRLTEDAIDFTGEGSSREEVMAKDGISDRVATNLTNAGFSLFLDDLLMSDERWIIRGKSIFEQRLGGEIDDDVFRNPYTEGTENIVTNRQEFSLSYNRKLSQRSEIKFTSAYVNHKRDATNDAFLCDYMQTHNDSTPDVRDMRPYVAHENTLSSTFTYSISVKKHNLIMGVQDFRSRFDESGMYVVVDENSSFYGESYRSDAVKKAWETGFFIQDEWNVNNKLSIVPGVRIDRHTSGESYISNRRIFDEDVFPETTFEQTVYNPRLAILYSITPKIKLRFNTGTGFRAPFGFSEDLHLCSGSPRVWKSAELKPETARSFNFSVDYYNKYFRTSANVFRTDLKDKIAFSTASTEVAARGYDYQWENIDDAFVQGVELSLIVRAVKNLNIGLDYTINRGEYKNVREDWEGSQWESISRNISRSPQNTANIKLEYTPKSWTISVLGNYQGKMYIDYVNEEIDPALGDMSKIKKTDPFMLVNARVSKQFNQLSLYAGANNIFNYIQDEKYLDDPAFLYAPVYGTMIYGGLTLSIKHKK